MMPLTEFLNASVVSIGVLVSTGVGVLMVTEEGRSSVFRYITERYETVNMTSKGGARLGESVPPTVGAGIGSAQGVTASSFLELMKD